MSSASAVEMDGGVWGNASPPRHHPISQLDRKYFILRRRVRYSPPRCFLHGAFFLVFERQQATTLVPHKRNMFVCFMRFLTKYFLFIKPHAAQFLGLNLQ
jgi:hypothetical protein